VSARAVDPARVVALVVGVERYAAGPRWTLPGPVTDALRFRDWLRSTGVPDANILLHLAPADGSAVLTGCRPADHETLRRALVHGGADTASWTATNICGSTAPTPRKRTAAT
jgi:hypothetical protein